MRTSLPYAVKRSCLFLLKLGIMHLLLSCSATSPTNQDPSDIRLDEAVALVYYSTSLSKEYYNKGSSYLLYIGKAGTVRSVKGEGLEWSAPVKLPAANSLVVQRKNEVHVQNNSLQAATHASPCTVSAGYRQTAGYLAGGKQYYALFNKGIGPDSAYVSTFRWGDENRHHCEDIGEFVEAQGSDEHAVYTLTSNHETLQGLNLVVLKPENGRLIQSKYPVRDMYTGSLIVQSDMISYQDKLYVVYSTRADDNRIELQVMEIDKHTRKTNTYPLHTYGNEPDNTFFSLSANSIGIQQNTLYYVDGYGTIFPFSLQTNTAGTPYSLYRFERKTYLNDEMGYVRGPYFYLYRFDEGNRAHQVEKYRLADGTLVSELLIPKVKDVISPEVYLYDFQMLGDL
ncbi:hypothetical protein [Paenibacillus apiarius]|uniref:hypothetical protein n=1 Tax=Paenibacillus apiarius TaxID=46240 RepID=UPI003B3A84F5